MSNSSYSPQVERWGLFELVLQGSAEGNPFLETELTAQFSHGDRNVTVQGFYDGDGVYRVRFMPDEEGSWTFGTQSNQRELDGVDGEFRCVSPSAQNHGPVHVAGATHFAYADGTPYRPVGTTCYVWQLRDEALQERTLDTLRASPFNKLRFLVFPKHYVYNMTDPPCFPFFGELNRPYGQHASLWGRNKPPSPTWDYTRFNPAYFQLLERRILDLQRLGIEADVILFHPYDSGYWNFDKMPDEANQRYLRYLVARLAAVRNVWWSFANEYDALNWPMERWDQYFQLVQQLDPYDHLRSIHNMFQFYDHTKPWVTHCSVQHGDLKQMPRWLKQYGKPVVVDECGYEGEIDQLWGNLSPQELVMRFWLGFADGGYVGHSETYPNDREEIWWSHGGELRGESVPRIAFLRQIIEQVPGAGLTTISPTRSIFYSSIEDSRAYREGPAYEQEVLTGGAAVIRNSPQNVVAAGHSGSDYYLFYHGTHQPRTRTYHLPEGKFHIDLIDTWNMTIDTLLSDASRRVNVQLPVRPYLAVRIARQA